MLVLGSGGREHSICWKLKDSPLLASLHCLPGNAGIADVAECVSGISVADVPAVFILHFSSALCLLEVPCPSGSRNCILEL